MRTKYHYLPIILFIAVIFSTFVLGRCTAPTAEIVPPTTDALASQVSEYQKQAMQNAEIIADKTDTIQILQEKIRTRDSAIQILEAKTSKSKEAYKEIKQEYAAADRYDCDTIIAAADSVISHQTAEIDTLQTHFRDITKMVDKYAEISEIQQEQINAANRLISQLNASNRRTWLERNAKWIALGGGILAGAAGTAAVMK